MSFDERRKASEEKMRIEHEQKMAQMKAQKEAEEKRIEAVKENPRYIRMNAIATLEEIHDALKQTIVKLVSKNSTNEATVQVHYLEPKPPGTVYYNNDHEIYTLGKFLVTVNFENKEITLEIKERTKPHLSYRTRRVPYPPQVGGGMHEVRDYYELPGGLELTIYGGEGSKHFVEDLRISYEDIEKPKAKILDFLADIYVGRITFFSKGQNIEENSRFMISYMSMPPQKWTLLSKKDVSLHAWFPIEMRTYELPNGKIVDDFSVTTLADVAMIVPVTKDEKIVLVRQFKPGAGDVILEFPAGRLENEHKDVEQTALHELEEETGIRVDSVEYFSAFISFPTKGTEKVFCYLAENVEFNSNQNLDENEEIEVVVMSFQELEAEIASNSLQAAVTVAAWELAKKKYSSKFRSWVADIK